MTDYGWLDQDTWRCFVPVTPIIKGGKAGAAKDGKRWIQGVASTSSRDLQGEVVEQSGMDVSYFLKHGYFNNDHKDGFANKVGQPTEARVTKDGLWVKGFLFKDKKVADEIWEMMQSLERSGADRKIGFSIQGKVKKREGNLIKECWIQDIAITTAPVNTTTWAEIVKSMSVKGKKDEAKALTASGNGADLVPESLEGEKKEDLNKSFTFDETVDYLMKSHGLPFEAAEGAAHVIFHMYGKE